MVNFLYYGAMASCTQIRIYGYKRIQLSRLINHALSQHIVISATGWKEHKIVPVFKAGDPIASSVQNHRPISPLSNISKC